MVARRAVLLLALALLVPDGVVAGLLGRSNRACRRADRRAERRSSAIVFGGLSGAAGWAAAGQITTTWQPGGMAYFRLARPLLSPQQQAIVALAAAAAGAAAVDEWLWFRNDALGRTIRSVGAMPLEATDELRRRWQEWRRRRERDRCDRWLSTHTRPAKIYLPS